jgi:predicted N-acetyltransferase YhbS
LSIVTADLPAPEAPAPSGRNARDQTPSPVRTDGRPTTEALVRELTEDDLPAMVVLCQEALDLAEDAAEAAQIVDRLRSLPTGRRPVALVAADDDAVVGVVLASLSHRDPTMGHVDLVVVHPRLRRRGIGRALLGAAETALAGVGVGAVLIAGNMPYAWPGIDVRYTPAVCAALALGYQQERTAWNMTADLSTPDAPGLRDTGPAERRLADRGVHVRRATVPDLPALTGFIKANFSGGWAWEVEQSIGRDGAGCHLAAHEDGEILGFAAYGALRPTWFGPMGTAPGAQGSGIGGVLLRRCLADQRAAGHTRVQIGWVGPVPFYSRTVGAYIERVFFLYRKEL